VLAEQVGQAELAALLVEEAVIPGDGAGRQRAALLGDALDLPAERDLLGEQGGAGVAVVGAFAGPAHLARRCQLGCRLELILGRQRGGAHLRLLGLAATRRLPFLPIQVTKSNYGVTKRN
jgi:hypothetical protein